ncbi:RNA polymerase sigma factor RpoD/SigA [Nanoarchaeota archaeon]
MVVQGDVIYGMELAKRLRSEYSELFEMILSYRPSSEGSGRHHLDEVCRSCLSPDDRLSLYRKGVNVLDKDNPYRMYSLLEGKLLKAEKPNGEAKGMFYIFYDELGVHRTLPGIVKERILPGLKHGSRSYVRYKSTLAAIEKIETTFLGLMDNVVDFLSYRYSRKGMSRSDLMQEGYIGVLRAATKYDHSRGVKFQTYAVWWARQSVTRALANQGKLVRKPIHRQDNESVAKRTYKHLLDTRGKRPSVSEVAEELGMSEEVVADLLKADNLFIGIGNPMEEEGVVSEPAAVQQDAFDCFVRDELEDTVQHVLARWLKPREERVLRMRMGIGCRHSYTLDEIGTVQGCTRERVRQIEEKALGKLRRYPQVKRALQDFL